MKIITKKIPELRFPEFKGEWGRKRLREIASKIKEKNKDVIERCVLTNSAIKGIVDQSDYFDKDIVNQNNLNEYYIVDIDDFVYNPRISEMASVGPFKRNELRRGVMSPLYTIIRFKSGNLNFYQLYLSTKCWHKYMRSVANYGARFDRMNITTFDFFNMPIPHPCSKEQKKIAAFLSAVDRQIEGLEKKKGLLSEYKKGVMQKLFDQTIRFLDNSGNQFPDWEEKRLGEVLAIGSGRDYKHLEAGNIPVFGSGGFMTSVSDSLYSGETVFIGRKGSIDKPFYFNGSFWTVDTLFYTHSFKNLDPKFCFAIFQIINWKKHNEASGVPSLSKATIQKIKINLPSLPEQKRIAEFLSALDGRIDTVTKEISKMREFKKGLLQKMFV